MLALGPQNVYQLSGRRGTDTGPGFVIPSLTSNREGPDLEVPGMAISRALAVLLTLLTAISLEGG